MKTALFKLQGSDLSGEKIAEEFRLKFDPTQVEHRSINDTHIICAQRFYWRTASNLLAVLLINPFDDDSAEIEFIVGGGGAGVFDWTWWSESKEIKILKGMLQELCSTRKWTFTEIRET